MLNSKSRSHMVFYNIIASFIAKGWSAVVMLFMVPLTLKCLDVYQNGVWLTISSLLVWIDQMDIGLGNGLRNSLTTYIAHDDIKKARQAISSTMAMLVIIILPIFVILSLLVWYGNVYAFLNVIPEKIPELRVALLSAVTLVCFTFVFKFIGNVYMGMQLPAVNNYIITLGQTIALLTTWLLFVYDKATFFNIVVVNTASPLLIYIFSYPYTFYVKYPSLRPSFSFVSLQSAFQLGNLGVKFFWLQVAGIIQFMTTNILISKFFTPAMVTPYQIAHKYLSLVIVLFTVVCMPFWNATTDAYARGDMSWIESASRKMNIFTFIIFLLLVLMTVISPYIYHLWIGDDCYVPFGMTIMVSIYIFLLALSMRYSYFLNGVGALRLQLYMTVTAVIFIPLAWITSSYTHNIMWFLAVMCLCNIPGILVNLIQFNKILKGKAERAWRI